MKWERIDPADSQWWSKTLEKAQEIQRAIDSDGKALWNLSTYEDGEVNVERVLTVDGSVLYFVSRGLSTEINVAKIQSFTKDAHAQGEMQDLPDLVSKEAYLAEWSSRGTYKLNPRWVSG